jgi:hypothetical protein
MPKASAESVLILREAADGTGNYCFSRTQQVSVVRVVIVREVSVKALCGSLHAAAISA